MGDDGELDDAMEDDDELMGDEEEQQDGCVAGAGDTDIALGAATAIATAAAGGGGRQNSMRQPGGVRGVAGERRGGRGAEEEGDAAAATAIDDENEEDDEEAAETGVCFSDPGWLAEHGGVVGSVEGALEYFGRSQFYDRTCTAEVLRMQRRAPTPELLRQMRGIEFTVDTAASVPPTLFVVRKGLRTSDTNVEPLAVYYIVDGIIYRAPSPRSVVAAAVRKSLFLLSSSIADIRHLLRSPSATSSVFMPTQQQQQRPPPSKPRRVTMRSTTLPLATLESRVDKAIIQINAVRVFSALSPALFAAAAVMLTRWHCAACR